MYACINADDMLTALRQNNVNECRSHCAAIQSIGLTLSTIPTSSITNVATKSITTSKRNESGERIIDDIGKGTTGAAYAAAEILADLHFIDREFTEAAAPYEQVLIQANKQAGLEIISHSIANSKGSSSNTVERSGRDGNGSAYEYCDQTYWALARLLDIRRREGPRVRETEKENESERERERENGREGSFFGNNFSYALYLFIVNFLFGDLF